MALGSHGVTAFVKAKALNPNDQLKQEKTERRM